MQIGTSFNIEHHKIAKLPISTKLDLLRYCTEELGISHLRLAIRWSDVYKPDGTIDLGEYTHVLNYVASNPRLKLTLNIGPIKTMRWPEETIPHAYFSLAKRLKGKSLLGSKLGETALEYLSQLLEQLADEYPSLMRNLYAVQLDNEPFNKFGQFKLELDEEWILATLRVLAEFFPQTQVLFNSNGRRDLRKITNLIDNASTKFSQMSWIIGVNYYYQVPIQHRVPIINKLDNLTLSMPWDLSISDLKEYAVENNVEIEVSELQGEPWLKADKPGNSLTEFERSIKRASRVLTSSSGVVRYWGIEHLLAEMHVGSLSVEQQKILQALANLS